MRSFETAPAEADLAHTVDTIVTGFLDAFRSNRKALVAFMLINRSEPSMRLRGAEASRAAGAAISQRLEDHHDKIAHPDPTLAAEFAYRTLFAIATQTVMFDDLEISDRCYTERDLAAETTALLLAYLRSQRN